MLIDDTQNSHEFVEEKLKAFFHKSLTDGESFGSLFCKATVDFQNQWASCHWHGALNEECDLLLKHRFLEN